MIEEQTRVEVVVEVDPELQLLLGHDMELGFIGYLVVLLAARAAAPCAQVDVPDRDAGDLRQHGQRLVATAAHVFFRDLARRRVLLHVQPATRTLGARV